MENVYQKYQLQVININKTKESKKSLDLIPIYKQKKEERNTKEYFQYITASCMLGGFLFGMVIWWFLFGY